MFLLQNISELLHTLIYVLPAVILCLSVHEFAHAFVAYRLGDESQRFRGRLSLNPLRHLDIMGTICLIIAGFGWAKPVQIDPSYFKNAKNGMMWSALAGPLSNFVLAFIALLCYWFLLKIGFYPDNAIAEYLYTLLTYIAILSAGLGIFNMLPLPPLDGSKILLGILNEETYFKIMRYERYLGLILMLLLISGSLDTILVMLRSGFINICNEMIWMLLGI